MKRKILYSRKFWLMVLVMLISLVSIVIYANYSIIVANWFGSLQIAIGIFGIVATLFNYWKRFNLLITKVWIILTNATSIWNVASNFEGDFNQEEFKALMEDFKRTKPISDYLEVSDTIVRFSINGINYSMEFVDIETEEGIETQGKLYCYIHDFNSSYDYSIKIFEENIIPHFGLIEKRLRPETTTYNFRISFNGRNPFIRLITRNVNYKTVNSLWYTFNEVTPSGTRNIKISDKFIECSTSNMVDFQRTSTNFISLVGE